MRVSHDYCVEICNFFDKITRDMERRVTKRTGSLSLDSQRKIVAWADGEVYVKYGFHIRDLFA